MGVLERFVRLPGRAVEQRADAGLSWSEYVSWFQYQGSNFPTFGNGDVPGTPVERIENSFTAYTNAILKRNGVVAACMTARLMLFTEARFQWRRSSDRKLFGDADLSLVEDPWPGGSTGELLGRMEQDASLAGNSFTVRIPGAGGPQLQRLRPDWVSIIIGSNMAAADEDVSEAADARVVGYAYHPGGLGNGAEPVIYGTEEVGHYAPIPDPIARFRGMSWLTPILREVQTHGQATDHRAKYFSQGATPAFAIKHPPMNRDDFEWAVDKFNDAHAGTEGAWKTLHLAGGAEPMVLGANMKDLDYKGLQGSSETIIAAAARVPAVVVGIAEGLGGSALNSGNFNSARRQFGEQYAYPHWRMAAETLAPLLPRKSGAHLWYDTRDVAYLAEDRKDAAEVVSLKSAGIRQLVDAGYDPETVVSAVNAEDLTLLVHSGKLSVQLQPIDADTDDGDGDGSEPEVEAGSGSESESDADRALEAAQIIQKIYLGVGVVLSADEARDIANRAGAGLDGDFEEDSSPVLPPMFGQPAPVESDGVAGNTVVDDQEPVEGVDDA